MTKFSGAASILNDNSDASCVNEVVQGQVVPSNVVNSPSVPYIVIIPFVKIVKS